MFDALGGSSSSRFMVENKDIIDHLKRTGGKNWRAITAAVLLKDLGDFIWLSCPLSADIVSALEEISQRIFPPRVVSTMEGETFPFDFPYPESGSLKVLLRSFSREYSPCTLPRWFSIPPFFFPAFYPQTFRTHLGLLHNYIRFTTVTQGTTTIWKASLMFAHAR
ncbi:hypothetical protein BJ165DRAFT_767713 [Panaeolus papilionaceus]|nr:hypothetical protein BJ165DRAFT_767713 [Panaeolus papilionaceus]